MVTTHIPSLELFQDPPPAVSDIGKIVDVVVHDWRTNTGNTGVAIRLFSREAGNGDRPVVVWIEPDEEAFIFCEPLAKAKKVNFHLKVKLGESRQYHSKQSGELRKNWSAEILPLRDQHPDVFGFYKASPEELQVQVERTREAMTANVVATEKANFESCGAKPSELKAVEVVDHKTPANMAQAEQKPIDDVKSPRLKTTIQFDSPEQAMACYRGVEDIRDMFPKMPQGRILSMAAFLGMQELKRHFDVGC